MPSRWSESTRAKWKFRGQERPPFALAPGPGQESVWDYPRPPRLAPDSREVVVRLGAVEIARSSRTIRVLETASPPTFYIRPDDVAINAVERAEGLWVRSKGSRDRKRGSAWPKPSRTKQTGELRLRMHT